MVQQIKNNPLFQVGLDVFDSECLVIGGGNESEEKCGRLLDAGANIQIIAKELTPILKKPLMGKQKLSMCLKLIFMPTL